MDKLRRRKFNVYYWTCTVIAICVFILSDIEWGRILALLLGATLLPFYILDDRGKFAFEDGESND